MSYVITADRYRELQELSGGVCRKCGAEAEGDTEPDAENYPCLFCDEDEVFGIENALIMGIIEVEEDEDE